MERQMLQDMNLVRKCLIDKVCRFELLLTFKSIGES